MGYNTTIVVMNDSIDQIRKDSKFGEKVYDAILEASCYRKPVDISSGNHCNAATVVETHHADASVYVKVGQNCGEVVSFPMDAVRERNLLATAIGDAAIKCGMVRADIAGLTGPQLLGLINDMADCILAQNAVISSD